MSGVSLAWKSVAGIVVVLAVALGASIVLRGGGSWAESIPESVSAEQVAQRSEPATHAAAEGAPPEFLGSWPRAAHFLEEEVPDAVLDGAVRHYREVVGAVKSVTVLKSTSRRPFGNWPGAEGWEDLGGGRKRSPPSWVFNEKTTRVVWAGPDRWRGDAWTTSAPFDVLPDGRIERIWPSESLVLVQAGTRTVYKADKREAVREPARDSDNFGGAFGQADPHYAAFIVHHVRSTEVDFKAQWAERVGVKYLVLELKGVGEAGIQHYTQLWLRPGAGWALVREESVHSHPAYGSSTRTLWQALGHKRYLPGLWLPLRTIAWVSMKVTGGTQRGHTTVTHFRQIEVNEDIDELLFEWSPPADVRVVDKTGD